MLINITKKVCKIISNQVATFAAVLGDTEIAQVSANDPRIINKKFLNLCREVLLIGEV
jgi:hypothetical protein